MDYGDHFRNGSNLGGADPGDDEPEMVTCPACEREQDEVECYLGTLGRLRHFRCRYCGMGFNSDGGQEWNGGHHA